MQDFHHSNVHGGTRLLYQAEHTSTPVWNLDSFYDLLATVKCAPTGDLILNFTSADSILTSQLQRHLQAGVLVTGASHWKCQEVCSRSNVHHEAILRRVTGPIQTHGNVLLVPARCAVFAEFFKHLRLHFGSNKFPSGHHKGTSHSEVIQDESKYGEGLFADHLDDVGLICPKQGVSRLRRRLLGWFSSAFSSVENFVANSARKVWSTVKAVAHTVKKVVVAAAKVVAKVAKAILTGDFSVSPSWHRGWKWNTEEQLDWSLTPPPATAAPTAPSDKESDIKASKEWKLDETLNCKNCYATAEFGIEFDLEIKDYSLSTASLIAGGYAGYNLEGSATVNATYHREYHKMVQQITADPIRLWIGPVPVELSVEVPITIGVPP